MPEVFSLLEELALRKNESKLARISRALQARYKAHPGLVELDLDGLAERMNDARKCTGEESMFEHA